MISFEVDTNFVKQVRNSAVDQPKAKKFSNLPERADVTKTDSSFGLPSNWFGKLQKAVKPYSGKIEQLTEPFNFRDIIPPINFRVLSESGKTFKEDK